MTGGYILKRVEMLMIDAANRVARKVTLQMCGEAPPSNIIAFQLRGHQVVLTACATRRGGREANLLYFF